MDEVEPNLVVDKKVAMIMSEIYVRMLAAWGMRGNKDISHTVGLNCRIAPRQVDEGWISQIAKPGGGR